MDPTLAALIGTAVGMAIGAIIKELGGWASDHIRLKRVKLQVKIYEEEVKMPKVDNSPQK